MYREAILALIKENPGISRQEIFEKFWPNVLQIELTNYLAALRRQGKIENRGTKKYSQWHNIEQNPSMPAPKSHNIKK